MSVKRFVPNLPAGGIAETERLLVDILGFHKQMDMGWVMTYVSIENPATQVTVLSADPSGLHPEFSIEVANVDAIHLQVVEAGLRVVYGPADEPWQVRRFFVELPNGVLINVMGHTAD